MPSAAFLRGDSRWSAETAHVLNHPQHATIRAKHLDLIFLKEPQGMAALRIESPAAISAVANEQRFSRRIAVAKAQLGERPSNQSSNRFSQLSVMHGDFAVKCADLMTFVHSRPAADFFPRRQNNRHRRLVLTVQSECFCR